MKRQHRRANVATSIRDAGQTLRQAESALAKGDVEVACQMLSQVREAQSTPEGRKLVRAAFTAQTYERWEKPARALGSIERALQVAPAEPALHKLRGTLLRRSGRLRAAVAELDEARRLLPGNPSVALESLLTHLATGDRGAQLGDLAGGVSAQGTGLGAALPAAADGDLATAERELARSPQPAHDLTRAVVLLAKGEGHRALPLLERSVADNSLPNFARSYAGFYLGVALVRRRQLPPAAHAFEEALELGLPQELAREHLVWTYNQLVIDAVLNGKLADAADWLNKLVALGGTEAAAARQNVAYVLSLLGQERARAGAYDEATRVWREALEITPRDFALRQNLAVALERADRADEAIPHWHELVQQLSKGSGKVKKDQPDGRVAAKDEALTAHVRAVAHRHLADLYLEEDDVERAIVQMERALAVVPDDVDTRRELARLLMEEGSTRKAIPHYQRLVAAQPEVASHHLELGMAHEVVGEIDAELAELSEAYALEPTNQAVRLTLGKASGTRALAAPEAATAAGDAHRAMELLPPEIAVGTIAFGAVQLAGGKRREAAKAFKKAIKQAANKAVAVIAVGGAYWRAGERDLAVAAWVDAMKKALHQPRYFATLAERWAEAGDPERCRECFAALLSRGLLNQGMGAIDKIAASPQLRPLLRQVVGELEAAAPGERTRLFVCESLLHLGDLPASRAMMNRIALEAVANNEWRSIVFVTELDYRYRFKLLERKVAMAVSHWLDAHPSRAGAIGDAD